MSGHVTRYKNAKLFVPIGAGGLPFVVGRLKRNPRDHARHLRSGRGAGLIYTDTIEHDPRVLRFVIEMMGADRVMLGSDMPFPIGDHEPMKIVADAGPRSPIRSQPSMAGRLRSCSAFNDTGQKSDNDREDQ